jgi:hypothetical protein
MAEQHALTVIVPVAATDVDALRALLNAMGQHIDESGKVPLDAVRPFLPPAAAVPAGTSFIEFRQLTTVHFFRFVLLESSRDATGNPIAPSLVFATDFDGPVADHVNELVRVAEPALRAVFMLCQPSPGTGPLQSYLHEWSVSAAAFYRGHPGRSVSQIWGSANHSEAELRQVLEQALDVPPRPQTAALVVDRLRYAVGHSVWKAVPTADEPARVNRTALISTAAVGLLLFSVMAVIGAHVFGSWMAGILSALLLPVVLLGIFGTILNGLGGLEERREQRLLQQEGPPPSLDGAVDPYVPDRSRDRLTVVEELEDKRGLAQNQMTHVVNIKPGRIRLWTLRATLAIGRFLSRNVFVAGTLLGIPTIHFARWVFIDDNRRLLFFSNYDFSWESYLGDFIDLASDGLTSIWSNTTFFPRTRIRAWTILPRLLRVAISYLPGFTRVAATVAFTGGAQRERAFKRWTRDHQVATHVWYSAYPHLSVTNVNNSTELQRGVFTALENEEQQAWLRRL